MTGQKGKQSGTDCSNARPRPQRWRGVGDESTIEWGDRPRLLNACWECWSLHCRYCAPPSGKKNKWATETKLLRRSFI